MSQIWFTSDLHFGHPLVADIRGFGDDIEEHDQTLINRWNEKIREDDTVWVLGDISVHRPDKALSILGDLPGKKHLIAGNHDACHPMHRSAHKQQGQYLEVFDSVQMAAKQKWDGKVFLLSHFPYSRDRNEVRYTQWRLKDEGEWLIHGHVHTDEKLVGNEIHVGVDAWDFSPVSLNTVLELTKTQPEPVHLCTVCGKRPLIEPGSRGLGGALCMVCYYDL